MTGSENDGTTCEQGHVNPSQARYCVACGDALTPDQQQEPVTGFAGESVVPALPDPDLRVQGRGLNPTAKRAGILGGALTLVVLGLGMFLLLTAPVPNVSGRDATSASSALMASGFTLGESTMEFSESVERGLVAAQSPSGGSRGRKGGSVDLVVSRGPAVEVPDLVGVGMGTAAGTLKDIGLQLKARREISETVMEGTLMAQSTAPGTQVEEGSEIEVTVSAGPPVVTMTYVASLDSLVSNYDWSNCSLTVSLWKLTYNEAVVVNRAGKVLSTISSDNWSASPNNGTYYPCSAEGTFPKTPTTEDEYRVNFSQKDPEGNSSDWITRAEMEASDWVASG